jgi:integrase/recombinase XerD
MKLAEALTKYLAWGKYENQTSTSKSYQVNLRQFSLYMHNCEIEEVDLADILSFYDLLLELGIDKSSLSSKSCACKQFFEFFHKQGYKVMSPELIPILKTKRKFAKLISKEDVAKLLGSIGEREIHDFRDKLCVMLLRDTGMRVGELLALDVSQIDLAKMETVIQTEKTPEGSEEEQRTVFWTKETHKVLLEYLKMRNGLLTNNGFKDSGALLISIWGQRTGYRMSINSLEQQFVKMSSKAKLGYTANPHRFRHSFGRKLALGPNGDGEGGANAHIIKGLMGHKNIRSSEPYTEMNPEMKRKVYERFFREG